MTQKITLRMSAAAAPYVRPDTPGEIRLQAARGQVSLGASDMVVLLYFLTHDNDAEIKHAALKSLRDLPEAVLHEVVQLSETNGKILDVIARLHFSKLAVAEKITIHPNCSEATCDFLVGKGVQDLRGRVGMEECSSPGVGDVDEDAETADDEVINEEDEEFKSKYQLSQQLGVSEKIKMSLTGDKEWRSILIKDSNKLVSGAVVKNPRITEAEILAISKSKIQNDEIMRVICANKEWTKNYMIKKALVENTKTPLAVALRFMGTLTEKDLSGLAKSKNVSSVIATQARRVLLNKSKKS
ncbi:hypothetical protein Geob_2388 [Geotalea daltonii FRC-32]|uniref:Uncharacterized protein n=1 Tax=Geotalea daltonii (strain DSM 22248 / JCM 15807 / FRC-32) TaxID=316067 RepID=B9LZI9_GEODF|nr:hypothetical protein [Geotalea daltonii]ACM20742.1 hypothetical protein Geob_2388 [Geotalea daltonii FRC-32]